jgi:hypothetical protein
VKRALRRLSHRLKDNFKMDLKEIGCDNMDCIYLALDRDWWQVLVNMV